LRHEELKVKAQANTQHEVLLEPRRGDILDAKGNLLATSIIVKRVCADPTMIGSKYREVAHVIAPILQENEAPLAEKLKPSTINRADGESVPRQYVVIKKRVPTEIWDRVKEAMNKSNFEVDQSQLTKEDKKFYQALRSKGVFDEEEQMRIYPAQRLASH